MIMTPPFLTLSSKSRRRSNSTTSSSTSISSIEHVLKLNNKGTKLLVQHKRSTNKAIASFSAALTELKDFLAAHPLHQDNNNRNSNSDFCFGFQFQSDSTCATTTSSSSSATRTANDIFRCPIKVLMEDMPRRGGRSHNNDSNNDNNNSSNDNSNNDNHNQNTKSLVMVSFAILYNLGICFHVSALHHHSNSDDSNDNDNNSNNSYQRRLQKALTLYETAQSLMSNHNQTDTDIIATTTTTTCTTTMISGWDIMEQVALFNNIGHVQLLLHNHPAAQQSYERLLSCLLWVTHGGIQNILTASASANALPLAQAHQRSAQTNSRLLFQFDLFWDNAMTHAVVRPFQSAAAAA